MKYTPNLPYNVLCLLRTPIETRVKGVLQKTYTSGTHLYVSFRTFGGTEREVNGQTVVENTAIVETHYRADIKSNCILSIDGIEYEILGTPEDIGMMHKYLRFKVRAIKGGA